MLASWVKQSTSTTGTGTITLDGTPADGYQAFSSAFTTGDIVQYTIKDGNNRESGYGELTSGADWTLTRTLIFETLVSDTYTRMPSTGITLSGSAVVGISSSAAFQNYPEHTDTYGHCFDNYCGYRATSVYSNIFADYVYYWPVLLDQPRKISQFQVNVATADAASTTAQIGLYSLGSNSEPNIRLVYGSIDASTTGIKTVTLGTPITLPAGWYALAFGCDSNTVAIDSCEQLMILKAGLWGAGAISTVYIFRESLGASWTDLPATATPSSVTANAATDWPNIVTK